MTSAGVTTPAAFQSTPHSGHCAVVRPATEYPHAPHDGSRDIRGGTNATQIARIEGATSAKRRSGQKQANSEKMPTRAVEQRARRVRSGHDEVLLAAPAGGAAQTRWRFDVRPGAA